MPAPTLTNLFLYAAQATVVIGALAALLAVLRLSAAFRLAACRAVLIALLVLPWLALLRTAPSGLSPVALSAAPGTLVIPAGAGIHSSSGIESRIELDPVSPLYGTRNDDGWRLLPGE